MYVARAIPVARIFRLGVSLPRSRNLFPETPGSNQVVQQILAGSLANPNSNLAENLLRPSRRNARFPDLGPTQVFRLLDARQGSGVTTF